MGLVTLAFALVLSACAPAPSVSTINDPFEARNRKVHAFNKSVDQAVLRPMAGVSGGGSGGLVVSGITNVASNLSMPGMVLNDLLQLNLADATSNTARFLVNSTFGFAGLFDLASRAGLTERSTDFGETLHVWGVPEGNFVELPLLGPSTQRDTAGFVVDLVIDPLNFVVPRRHLYVGPTVRAAKMLGDRSRFAGLFESLYYESADSYSQSRLLYLQSRRHQLEGGLNEDDLEDPYAE